MGVQDRECAHEGRGLAMEEKRSDRRAAYTRAAIRNAFFEIMREKGFAKMSVADICKRADISRGTFYLHYEDKFALLNTLIDAALDAAPLVSEKPSAMCQRAPSTEDDLLLYQDPATSPWVAQRIIDRSTPEVVPTIMKATGLSEQDASILFAHIVHGNLAVNQHLGWKGDARFLDVQTLLARFIDGGLSSLRNINGQQES